MQNNLLKPSHLKELCAKYNLTPSKKYGQNYLISDNPIKKMIEAADIKKGDRVIEIGPGFGVLTFALAEAGADVTAFEIERKLESYWDEVKPENVRVIWGDVLKEVKSQKSKVKRRYKVVANLPYQITSHVLRTLLELENKPESITVMVQKEVADRIVAKPGNLSLLAVSVQYYGEPRVVCKVPKGNFWPAPKVDSAVITIALKHPSTQAPEHVSTGAQFDQAFFRVVKVGFANKRKQVWRNLSEGLGLDAAHVKNVLQDVTGNEKIRAQEIGIAEWERIVHVLGEHSGREIK